MTSDMPVSTEHRAGFTVERPTIRVNGSGRMRDTDAAQYLGASTRELRKWRSKSEGPKYAMLAGRVWYHIDALDEYVSACERETTR